MEPWEYTLRELWWMAKSRLSAEWDQTSVLWATIANTARDSKRTPKPFMPADVHPFRQEKPKAVLPDFNMLKGLVDGWERNQGGKSIR